MTIEKQISLKIYYSSLHVLVKIDKSKETLVSSSLDVQKMSRKPAQYSWISICQSIHSNHVLAREELLKWL